MPKGKENPDFEKILLAKKSPFTVEQIAKDFSVETDSVRKVLDTLIESGYRFVGCDGTWVRSKANEGGVNFDARGMFKNGLLHFGVISDTHLGSKFERLDALEAMYDRFKREGVRYVFHVGDLTDGVSLYKGQEFEQTVLGQEAQIRYAIKKYPKRENVVTIVISGNHDLKAYEKGGCDPLVQIARERNDIWYIGQYAARVQLGEKINMDMLHPLGNQAYAVSYKAQRAINAMNPGDIPNILLYGHYHNDLYFNYRGVDFIQSPCFKDPSPQFEKRLGMAVNIGGWIVDGKMNGETISEFQPRIIKFGKK